MKWWGVEVVVENVGTSEVSAMSWKLRDTADGRLLYQHQSNEERVLVADFKTGRSVPESLAEVPVSHLRQMAAYRAALRVIFPDRPVETALLYTSAPVLHALSDALLDAHAPAA